MATTNADPVARIKDLLAGTAKPKSKTGSKWTRGRHLNTGPERRPNRLLTGIALRAAARKAAGKELSPLETDLLSTFKIWAQDDVIANIGQEFTKHKKSRALGDHMFPDAVVQLHDDEPYTREHLLRDTRKLAPQVAAQPENQMISIDTLLNGKVDSDEYKASLSQMGQGVTLFTSRPVKTWKDDSDEPEAQNGTNSEPPSSELWTVKEEEIPQAARQAMNSAKSASIEAPLELVFDRMHCTTKQHGEDGKDEIYVCFGAASDGGALSNDKTREYEAIQDGTWTKFDSGEKKLYSSNFRLTFNAHLEVWESDHTNDAEYDEMIKTLHDVAKELLEAAVEGMESDEGNEGAAVIALIAGILELVAWLLDIFRNQDDFLCRRTIAFNRAGIAALCNAPNQEMSLEFPGMTDEDGDWTGSHTVWIKSTKPTPPCGGLMATIAETTGSSVKLGARHPLSVNSKYGVGLACFKNQVVGMYGRGHEGIPFCTLSPISGGLTQWSSPQPVHDTKIVSRPALAVMGSKLHVCLRPSDDVVRWFWTEDLQRWSPEVTLLYTIGKPEYRAEVHTNSSVTMAGFDDSLFMMISNRNGRVFWLQQDPNSNTAAGWSPLKYSTEYGPSLVVFEGTLYCFFVDLNNNIFILQWNPSTKSWPQTIQVAFAADVYSALSCAVTKSSVLITYRNVNGTPILGSLTGLGSGHQPTWKILNAADTQAVGDPSICPIDGSPDAFVTAWAAAYYN